MAVSVGCVPLKRTSQTETVVKTGIVATDSMAEVTRQRLDLVMKSVAELRETMSEWLNESIDYTESRYDSLGRLVNTISQTTTRNSGRESAKIDNTSTYVGLTIEQVDSLFSARIATLKADIHTKEKVVEKVGLAWWQKTLIFIGGITLFWVLAFVIARLILTRK